MRPDPETINFMLEIAKLAVLKRDIDEGKTKAFLSFREACTKYGPAIVKRWHEEGLVKFLQDGPNKKIRIDRLKIEAVAKSSNRGL